MPAPVNDNFASRTVLGSVPILQAGTNVSATLEAGEPSYGTASVWYEFTPATTGTYIVYLTSATFDSKIGVYTGTAVNSLTIVDQDDDDDDGLGSSYSADSFVAVSLTAGTAYKIAVTGFGGGDEGTFDLNIALIPSPTNDDFANRTVLSGSDLSTTGSNLAATQEGSEPSLGFSNIHSLWYEWVAPSSGIFSFYVDAPSFNSCIAIFTGTALASLILIDKKAEGNSFITEAGDRRAHIFLDATLGTSYKILVDGASGARGDFTLKISSPKHITNATDLQNISSDLGAYYILDNDIELTSVSWTMLGTSSLPFFGFLEGNNKRINGLNLSIVPAATTSGVGLFRFIESAIVQNLTLTNFSITADITSFAVTNIGCLGGGISFSGIYNVHVMTMTMLVNRTTMTNNTSAQIYGGIAGSFSHCVVEDCSTAGNLTIDYPNSLPASFRTISKVGGLAGSFSSNFSVLDDVSGCTSTVIIIINGCGKSKCIVSELGGLFGGVLDRLNINNCSCSGSINCQRSTILSTGGFFGRLFLTSDEADSSCCECSTTMSFTDCLTTDPAFTFLGQIGGFVGLVKLRGTLSKCKSSCNINFSGSGGGVAGDCSAVGGFLGVFQDSLGTGYITDCFSSGSITVNCVGSISSFGGFIAGEDSVSVKIILSNCYANVNLILTSSTGTISQCSGFISSHVENGTSKLTNCFATGTFTLLGTISGTRFGGLIGFATMSVATFNIFNCSWLTSITTNAIGEKSTGGSVATLVSIAAGTDESTLSNFYSKNHAVYAQNTPTAWDFALIWVESSSSLPTISTIACSTDVEPPPVTGTFVRCAIAREAVNVFTTLSHLEGQVVGVIGNGNFLGFQRVVNGAIQLTQSYSHIIVGLPYLSDLETLPIEVSLRDGSIQGKRVKVANVTFRFIKSVGGFLGPNKNRLYEAFKEDVLAISNQAHKLDAPIGDSSAPKLYTVDVKQPLGGEYKNNGRVFYRQKKPQPVTIGAIVPEINIPSYNAK